MRIKLSLVQRRDLEVESGDVVYYTSGNGTRARAIIGKSPFSVRSDEFETCNNRGLAITSSYTHHDTSTTIGGYHATPINSLQISTTYTVPAPPVSAATASRLVIADMPAHGAFRGEDDGDLSWYVANPSNNR